MSDEEQADLFDTDNVVVCQYDKVEETIVFYYFYHLSPYQALIKMLVLFLVYLYKEILNCFIKFLKL